MDRDLYTGVGATQVGITELKTALGISISDQYGDGVDLTRDAYLAFDDFDDQPVKVTNNGSQNAKIEFTGTGSTAQVVMRLTFKNSNFVYERVINLAK